jgi:hypothetical protein
MYLPLLPDIIFPAPSIIIFYAKFYLFIYLFIKCLKVQNQDLNTIIVFWGSIGRTLDSRSLD